MIDLSEPTKKPLSKLEAQLIRQKFLILLHSLLLFYLLLHNLIIPLVVNLFKGQTLLADVHFWFIFQIPVHLWLRKGKNLSLSYGMFLIFGSFARMIFCTMVYGKSWGLVSVYLSELSSLVFISIIWQELARDRFVLLSFSGFLLTPFLAWIEISSPEKNINLRSAHTVEADYYKMGCQGSKVEVSQDLLNSGLSSRANILSCGMERNRLVFDSNVEISNQTSHSYNLRLYELKKGDKRFSWKFLRIIRINDHESVALTSFLKKPSMYLLKSPEHRELGMLVIIPKDAVIKGRFTLTPDTLNWRDL